MIKPQNTESALLERAVRASERRLAHAICSFQASSGYEVFRSDEFPGFYAGNGILVSGKRPELRVEDWVAVFREHFPNPPFSHVTVVFPDGTASTQLLDAAREQGLRVFPEFLMATQSEMLAQARNSEPSAPVPQVLDLARDREQLFALHLAEASEADWFEGPEAFRGLFNKTMALSDRVGIEWLAIREAGGGPSLAAALGYFDESPICRLQEVITAPAVRRHGLATRLIREAASRAVDRGVPAVGLVAEEGGEGHRLYRSLGFVELGCDITVMHY
jgi:GNAT superfamily N-acetyltransferase